MGPFTQWRSSSSSRGAYSLAEKDDPKVHRGTSWDPTLRGSHPEKKRRTGSNKVWNWSSKNSVVIVVIIVRLSVRRPERQLIKNITLNHEKIVAFFFFLDLETHAIETTRLIPDMPWKWAARFVKDLVIHKQQLLIGGWKHVSIVIMMFEGRVENTEHILKPSVKIGDHQPTQN